MINNVNQVHNQSICASYQAGSARRHLVFLMLDEKSPIFITGYEGQEKTQAFPPMERSFFSE